jgi:hypothetical protein
LVSTDGRRLEQSDVELARLSLTPQSSVSRVLERLHDAGILRIVEGSHQDPFAQDREALGLYYQVIHDGYAAALLRWHSQFVATQARPTPKTQRPVGVVPSPEHDSPYRLMVDLLRRGSVIPFLGAGVSLSARPPNAVWRENAPFLPSNRETKEFLARECGFPSAEFEPSSTAEVTSFYAHEFSHRRLDDRLHEILGRHDYVPSETHRFLADLARHTPLTILTTNYDTLMERALDEAGLPYRVVAYLPRRDFRESFAVYSPQNPQPTFTDDGGLYTEETLVFRLHGPALPGKDRLGSYVLTEEDQIEWLMRRGPSDSIPVYAAYMLRKYPLLSLGHSAGDWTQRALLWQLTRSGDSRGRPSWAVALNPAPLRIMTWQRYDVMVFNLDLNEWTARMREAGAA